MATLRTTPADKMHESEAEQVWLVQKDFAEVQRLAAELAERLGSLVFHAHTVNSVSDAIVLPDSLEMAEDLVKLLRAYVADPYNELCDCNAPLRRETCFVCSQHLCMSDEFGLALLSVGRDCGRTGYLCRVKGMTVEKPVCIRHTQEEIEARGLVYNAVTDDEA